MAIDHRHTGKHPRNRTQAGMTLLELLVVVFILASMALLTVSIVDSADEQSRFEATRTRLDLVKAAIVGPRGVTLNGEPLVTGFVNDMGRLPESLAELIEQGGLPDWTFDETTGLWAGWRGPYLDALLENHVDGSGGMTYTFRDGWDNQGFTPLFGWKRFGPSVINGDDLLMQSYGAEGLEGGEGYSADYPPEGSETLLRPRDYLVDVRTLDDITFTEIKNSTGRDQVVRLRMLYPRDGDFDCVTNQACWPANSQGRDKSPDLSGDRHISTGVSADVTFSFTVGNFPKPIPFGDRALALVDDKTGTIYDVVWRVKLVPGVALPSIPELTVTLKNEINNASSSFKTP